MRFRNHLIGASTLMLLAIWLSSGTMAPYAATWAYPIVSEECQYLYNGDHFLHRAMFDMLDGQPRELWEWTFVIRRLLFPVFAYPFMKVAGFEVGGFIASLLIHLAALIGLAFFLRRRWGEGAAIIATWLLATYPGITYWAALPYANATIVPISCALFMLVTRLDERSDLRSVVVNALLMSLLFTAYDLFPFFGVAAIFLLVRRRRWPAVPIAAACMAVGPVAVWLLVTKVLHVRWSNANTDAYSALVGAYLHPPRIGIWLRAVAAFPIVLGQVYFFSNLIFLPTLFLFLVILARTRLTLVEAVLSLAIALVFLFNNLAPPEPETYQMRGDYIPRLYQPLGIVLIVYCARVMAALGSLERGKAAFARVVFVSMLVGNLSVTFGPIARVPWAGRVYQRFYFHAYVESMNINLAQYGRRPLGFCKPRYQ